MHNVEAELLEATGFKPPREYKTRQDYLSALIVAVADLTDAQFDEISDEAAEWANKAAAARKAKHPILDFDGTLPEEPETEGRQKRKYTRVKREVEPLPHVGIVPLIKLNGKIDKFGVAELTRSSKALALLEKGVTMREVRRTLMGGSYYNLLKDMVKKGHRVEKFEDGIIKLTHKDEIGKTSADQEV